MEQLSEIRVQIPNIPNSLDIYGHPFKPGYFLLARDDMGRVKSAVSGLTISGRCGRRSICLANIQESLNVSSLREQRRQVAMRKHRLLTLALWTNLAMERVINARKKLNGEVPWFYRRGKGEWARHKGRSATYWVILGLERWYQHRWLRNSGNGMSNQGTMCSGVPEPSHLLFAGGGKCLHLSCTGVKKS